MKAAQTIVVVLAAAGTLACFPQDARAQDNVWNGGVGGNWTDATWSFSGPPEVGLDERGLIGSFADEGSPLAEVNVTTNVTNAPTLLLGDGADTRGVLNIDVGASLKVNAQSGSPGVLSSGVLSVGTGGGVGMLNVGGTLDVATRLESLNSANGDSTVRIGGAASVTAGSGFFDRQLIIDGGNASVAFANDLILGSDGTHTWKIPATGASTLLVGGNADLGGILRVEFPDGPPLLGTTWNLIDSSTVDGSESPPTGFGAIDQSAVTGLAQGATFAVQTVAEASSTHGVYTQLTLEQHPVLVIDRSTGAASIQNFSGGAATVDFDAYAVGSLGGFLNPAAWNRIDPAGGWVEAKATTMTLSELNPIGSESIAASASIALGSPFIAPSAFGESNEDISFRFAKPGQPQFTEGAVVYAGLSNSTLTLNVDPTTGEAQLLNTTSFSVSIDAYVITSASGSLDRENWNSLDDQGLSNGNWLEANSDANQLSELLVTGGLLLAPNSSVPLGEAFNNATGLEDLVFRFLLVEDSAGDFDADGDRDGADFLEWQRSGFGLSELAAWEAGFGIVSSGGASSTFLSGDVVYGPLVNLSSASALQVPEPGVACLLLLGAAAIRLGRATRRARRLS